MTVLELKGLTKYFGSVCAVEDVDISIKKGEKVGLLGDNGAGKSTIFKMVSGVHKPTKGDIFLDGIKQRFKSPKDAFRKGIQIAHQSLALIPTLSVYENFYLGEEEIKSFLGLNFLDDKTMIEVTAKEVKKLGLEVDPKKKVKDLSAEEQQGISVAHAIFRGSKILLLDEPTTLLSAKGTERFKDLINGIEKATICLITHNIDLHYTLTDRTVILKDGKKVTDEYTRDLEKDEIFSVISS